MRICDCSSDVCSSDLPVRPFRHHVAHHPGGGDGARLAPDRRRLLPAQGHRSEERRVGKECVRKSRLRCPPYHEKKIKAVHLRYPCHNTKATLCLYPSFKQVYLISLPFI